jgi:hypothetical protein
MTLPEPNYSDDRTTPEAVIGSFFNAINLGEYSRAYTYWEANAAAGQLGPFDQFVQGYSNTASVEVITGATESEGATGHWYFKVPVTLIATMTDGSTQTFVGCYRLHMANTGFQTQPPFVPLQIEWANVQQVDNAADTNALMAQACQD